MKKLGRIVMVLCAAVLMVVMAAACGGSEETKKMNVEGSWKRELNNVSLSQNQVTIYTNYLEGLPAQDTILKFESDGKLTITAKVDGKEASGSGSYSIDDDVITVNEPTGYAVGSAGSFKMSLKDNKLLLEDENYHYICFVKQ